ncbi:ABC transporter ATP-binding protein [Jidongwangia harbinensis]|uniref:ABC transporter ATP-binding protein n=1 Tax=Jidongwangia harbinensis TaxID=2878561 RepID=UPI001CD9E4DF|nr:ATP-binding cassette domain-containing protein [Jidongwangia harbinensis]MCA2219510.1 ATP-binding cassette domain-containing protein [Jidongwangia harbinensis]
MIAIRGLTKRYADKVAVDNISIEVAAGKVTGFLGPNGAGKSTTMRVIMGLDHPTAGEATISGKPYATLRWPMREVGALLDAKGVHPGRSGRDHLLSMAYSNGIPAKRVDQVLEEVGLAKVAKKRARGYSLGMSQRLGIAGALLGDPQVLLFDEPVNGLDTEGVRWVREMMRRLASEGRTVFVSSHLMSEMQQTADQLVIIGKGKVIMDAPMAEVIARGSRNAVIVRSPQTQGLDKLAQALESDAAVIERVSPHELHVVNGDVEVVGQRASELGVQLHELALRQSSLEDAYLELTAESVEYISAGRQSKA